MRGFRDTSRGYFQTLTKSKALGRASETEHVFTLNLLACSQGISNFKVTSLPATQIKKLGLTNSDKGNISQ